MARGMGEFVDHIYRDANLGTFQESSLILYERPPDWYDESSYYLFSFYVVYFSF